MISQQTFKRERRRLSIALGRADRARWLVPPNPYSRELNGSGLELVRSARRAQLRLLQVATEGLEIFEREGYPDSWARWESARDSARAQLRLLPDLEGFEQ